MYKVLYRKWRPQVFSDVVGQPHVTTTLANEIKTGRLAHAYLFAGSRGTGKTTCAKILAKAMNCLHPADGDPCNVCEICTGIDSGAILDVVEIDAASNNGVDNIRDLREEANFTPVHAKYRVYIIDEVHMLSTGAFNALLKTLEEPPPHVKFILATTESHKLPATILSRCQRFDFRRIPPEDIASRLEYVANQEQAELEHDAAMLIARLADGALRDALSILDQCTGRGKRITAELVSEVAGLTGRDYLYDFTDAICKNNTAQALEILDKLHNGSCDMERLCSELINHLRNFMIVKAVKDAGDLIVCSEQELEKIRHTANNFTIETILHSISLLQETLVKLKQGSNRRIEMEMALIRLCEPSLNTDNSALLRRIATLESAMRAGGISKQKITNPISAEQNAENKAITEPEKPKTEVKPVTPNFVVQEEKPMPSIDAASAYAEKTEPVAEGDMPLLQWPEVLAEIAQLDKPLIGILHGSSAYVRGEFLLVKSNNPVFSQFIRIGTHSAAMKEAVFRVTGKKYRLGIYKSTIEEEKPQQETSDPLSNLIDKLNNSNINFNIEE